MVLISYYCWYVKRLTDALGFNGYANSDVYEAIAASYRQFRELPPDTAKFDDGGSFSGPAFSWILRIKIPFLLRRYIGGKLQSSAGNILQIILQFYHETGLTKGKKIWKNIFSPQNLLKYRICLVGLRWKTGKIHFKLES